MLRRTVIQSKWYYDEKIMNMVAINIEDKDLSKCKQIKVTNKHESHTYIRLRY